MSVMAESAPLISTPDAPVPPGGAGAAGVETRGAGSAMTLTYTALENRI